MGLDWPPTQDSTFDEVYPERKGKPINENQSIVDKAKGKGYRDGIVGDCEQKIIKCFENVPYLKLLWNSLESQGCAPNLKRNFSCEICQGGNEIEHAGNYDHSTNQVVICANNVKSEGKCCGTLIRNMMDMFDKCTYKTDGSNVNHLACTEIRKANLADCNFNRYLNRKDAEFAVNGRHKDCVKSVALENLIRTKFVPEKVAREAINKVFSKCYNDMEPIGRRAVTTEDMQQAYYERYLFGY